MKQALWISSAALLAAAFMIHQPALAQQPAAGKAKSAQSPASRPLPPTLTPQTYPAAQVKTGEQKFAGQCGFCHGRDAAGGETGPDLTRSELVASDTRGDKLIPLIKAGRPEEGMPGFKSLSPADLNAMVAFIHAQKTKFEGVAGDRRSVDPSDLATGNAEAGQRYFNGAGKCSTCHSPTGDLAGVGTRFKGLALLQRLLYPSGRPAPARPKATVTLANGQIVTGPVSSQDEFIIVIGETPETRQTFQKSAVKFVVDDPITAHFDQLAKYTDADMHNIFAYLDTLK
ncbi:MAG: c-type cytochrome [Bryobacteraceae bacterium]